MTDCLACGHSGRLHSKLAESKDEIVKDFINKYKSSGDDAELYNNMFMQQQAAAMFAISDKRLPPPKEWRCFFVTGISLCPCEKYIEDLK